ncbi:hypothetical protein FRC09_019795 [Ceratobasidium sp. 395]|nr:hypothetical protein FRC09_019795 [Ceratobasidium sp. 395]
MSNQQPRPAKKSRFLPSQLSLRAAMGLLGRTSQSRSQSALHPRSSSVSSDVTPTPARLMPPRPAHEPASTHGASTLRSPGPKIKTTTAPQGEEIGDLDSGPLDNRVNRGKGKMIQGDGGEGVHNRNNVDSSGKDDESTGENGDEDDESSEDDAHGKSDTGSEGDEDEEDGDDEDDEEYDNEEEDDEGIQASYEDEDELERDIARARARFEEARQEHDTAGGHNPIVKRKRVVKHKLIGPTGIYSGSSVLKEEMDGVKVKDFREGSVDTEVEKRLKAIERDHAYSCLMSLCNLKQAKDAAHLIPMYNENREPVYFDENNILIPHLDRPFDENFKVWGKRYYEIAADPTHMDEEHEDYLKTVPLKRFRDALPTGGGLDKKEEQCILSIKPQDGGQSPVRTAALDRSGLSTEAFGFVTHPGFQSSEHSDPDDKSHITIVSPEYRTPKVVELVDALDLQYNITKKRSGNRVYTRVDRIKANSKVPALKNPEMKVHKWAIDPKWMVANPGLERNSRPFVDSRRGLMPDEEEVERFIHDHEPDERAYVSQDLHDPPPAPPTPQPIQPNLQPASSPVVQGPLSHAHLVNPAPFAPALAQELVQIPRYVPYELPTLGNQFPQYVVQPQDGQLPPPTDASFFGVLSPNFMLGDGQYNPGFSANGPGALDVSHPFNLPDRVDFQETLANGAAPCPKFPSTESQPSHDAPSPAPLHNASGPVHRSSGVKPPVEQVQPARLSGRKRKASTRAVEAAEAAEAFKDSDTTVLKPKLSKVAKEKLKRVGKGKSQKQERVKASSLGHNSERPAAGPSRIPFPMGNIKRISVKKLHGE